MSSQNVRVISDTHFLDKSFPMYSLLWFLQDSDCQGFQVIFNGDILELWDDVSGEEIVRRFHSVFQQLAIMQPTPIIILGNHDVPPWGKGTKQLLRKFGLRCRMEYKADDTVYIHGHIFDSPNKPKRKVGYIITRALNWLRKRWSRNTDLLYQELIRMRPVNKEAYVLGCIEHATKRRVKTVVYGHTHAIDMWSGGFSGMTVLNSGTWNGNRQDFLERVDGKWSIKSWG